MPTKHLQSNSKSGLGRLALCALALALPLTAGAALPQSQIDVLEAIYDQTNGDNWNNNSNWKNGGDPCDTGARWYGITCDTAGNNVTGIDLYSNNLNGTLPDLSDLGQLKEFDAYSNQLSGTIPNLPTSLEHFDVDENQLTGFPGNFSGLGRLKTFFAYDNQLSGPLPDLPDLLEYFGVGYNQLTGFPGNFSTRSQLKGFYANNNQLSGTIPNLPDSLETFYAPVNQLSGTIPNLPDSLEVFGVEFNQLTSFPGNFSTRSQLKRFYVRNNHLTGTLPAPLPASLERFRVQHNQLSGTLPAAPGNLEDGESALCPNNFSDTATHGASWAGAIPANHLDDCNNYQGPHTITPVVNPAGGGTLTCTVTTATHGGDVNCTATPAANFAFVDFAPTVCDAISADGSTCYLRGITADVTVTANMRRIATPVLVPVNHPLTQLLLLLALSGLALFALQRRGQ